MDQRLVFSSIALELVVAYWLIPVSFLVIPLDLVSQGKLYLFMAEISLGITVTSLVLFVLGLLHRRRLIPARRRVLVGLSWLAIPGILYSGYWANFALLTYPEGCDPITVWKCYFADAGGYIGYYFFPAIAIPIVTLVWISRIRTQEKIAPSSLR